MFESVWIIQENIKLCGPTRQPHGPNNGAAVPSTFRPRPPPCPSAASLDSPACRPAHRFRRARPPPRASIKRSTPPRELHFSSSAQCCHWAVVPPSLSHHQTLPRSPSKLPITAPSSAPTSGAPVTYLPAPSAAPPLHHHRSSRAEPSHRGQPAPVLLQRS
jgi:hypothetical protein